MRKRSDASPVVLVLDPRHLSFRPRLLVGIDHLRGVRNPGVAAGRIAVIGEPLFKICLSAAIGPLVDDPTKPAPITTHN